MPTLKLAPPLVVGLIAVGILASWLAGRSGADAQGFAAATAVALWSLGGIALAGLVAAAAMVVAIVNRRKVTRVEFACGALPLPILLLALVAGFAALR